MASSLPAAPEFMSTNRIKGHITLLRKFECILDDAGDGGRHASRFPPTPAGFTGPEGEARWRVQCLLMSAEVRYSLYLKFLDEWFSSHRSQSSRSKWPLPPWDVAIIFYAHLLAPFNFKMDIKRIYPALWGTRIEFPITRMSSSNTDEASEYAWTKHYPDIPYRAIEWTATGDHSYLAADHVLDIPHFHCMRSSCRMIGTNVIPINDWANYRAGSADLECPRCQWRFPKSSQRAWDGTVWRAISQFDFTLFNLWHRPLRQFCKDGFVDRVLALNETQGVESRAIVRYLQFLQLIKERKLTLVPTLDVDLIWHTHQLSPLSYHDYCRTHVGRLINHDDTMRATNRSVAIDRTARAWVMRYNESYFEPHNQAMNAEIKRQKDIYNEKEDNKRKLLSEFDKRYERQRDGLSQAVNLVAKEQSILEDAREAARASGKGLACVESAKRLVQPSIRLFGWRYYRTKQRLQLHELEKTRQLQQKAHTDNERKVNCQNDKLYRSTKALDRCRNEWREVQRQRRLYERSLQVNMDLAFAAVWQCSVKDREPHQERWYSRESWYSIVPSEVQCDSGGGCSSVSSGGCGGGGCGGGGCGGGGCGGGGCGGGGCGGGGGGG